VVPVVFGEEIWYFPSLERGMEKAKELIKLYPRTANGRILWIGEVLKAKGRFQRRWYAEKGGLWLVITLYDELIETHRNLLALLIGLSLVRAVRDLGAKEVYLKWINDLHFRGRKLAGTLIEYWKGWFIIGVGLNVNNNLPKFLPAISLKEILKREVSLSTVLSLIINYINYYYHLLWNYDLQSLYEEKLPNPLILEFKKYSDTLGRCVFYHYNLDGEESEGLFAKAVDLDSDGSLILEYEEELLKVSTGEILYIY
jgi:BirA family biotin operon repressor/biotin-[acetyl-CoA-carboxylase] ligase